MTFFPQLKIFVQLTLPGLPPRVSTILLQVDAISTNKKSRLMGGSFL
jgi:hypothetical protein